MRQILRSIGCWLLGGHDDLTHFAPTRIFARCQTCRRETPGWTLDAPPPRVKFKKLIRFRRRLSEVA